MLVLIIISAVILPLPADRDFGSVTFFGGYSSRYDTPLLGIGGGYQYLYEISDHIGIGTGVHTDVGFGIGSADHLAVLVGGVFGLAFEARLDPSSSINLTIGPGVIAETRGTADSSVGIGLGADASYSFFFGGNRTAAVTAGATVYPQFAVFDDARRTPFSIVAVGYLAISFRFPSPLPSLAMPALGYLIY